MNTHLLSITIVVLCILFILSILSLQETHTLSYDEQPFNTYLINLDRNIDRRHHFNRTINSSDIPLKDYTLVSAVDAKNIDVSQFVDDNTFKVLLESEERGYRTQHYQITRGAVGCFLSHIEVWKEIVSTGRNGLVCEDDAVIHPKMYKKFVNNLSMIPTNWDIILMGYFCIDCIPRNNYMIVKNFHGTHAYIINPKCARYLLDHSRLFPIQQQIDAFLSGLVQRGEINIYSTDSTLINQNTMFMSDIQNLEQRTIDSVNPYAVI